MVLQLHQFLSMFPLLMRLVKKILGKVLQSHIIAIRVVRHGQEEVGRVELQVDLAVDGDLRVLAHLRVGGGLDGWRLRTGVFAALGR